MICALKTLLPLLTKQGKGTIAHSYEQAGFIQAIVDHQTINPLLPE
jgi:hypothetical protein